jgi:hypothetical protein
MSDVRAQRRLRTGGSQQTAAGDADQGQPAGVHVRGPTPPGLVLNQTKRSQALRTDCVRSPAGGVPQPGQALTPSEAVRAATVTAAASLHAPGAGGLAPGEIADFVVGSHL